MGPGASLCGEAQSPRSRPEIPPVHRESVKPFNELEILGSAFLGTRAAGTEFSRRHAVALGDRAATAAGISALPAIPASDSPIMAWNAPRERDSDSADKWGGTENFLAPSGADIRCEPLAISASTSLVLRSRPGLKRMPRWRVFMPSI